MSLYTGPREVRDLADCFFYHTMDLPGAGVVYGEWDLRKGFDEYIGGIHISGKRVLDVGTASGFVCFALEQRGATVVAYDLSPCEQWDIVPYGGVVDGAYASERRLLCERLGNSFWFAHRALGSSARLATGTAYAIPREIGPFDVAVLGCVLLHLRDPFLALQSALATTTETAVVVDLLPPGYEEGGRDDPHERPGLWFLPDGARRAPLETWWALSPDIVVRWLDVLGFGGFEVSFHRQPTPEGEATLFTVVGHRHSHASRPA